MTLESSVQEFALFLFGMEQMTGALKRIAKTVATDAPEPKVEEELVA